MSKDVSPKWWQVYLTLPLLVALFLVDSRLNVSTRGHQAVQIGIVLLVYGLIHLWLKANATALSRMDREEGSRRITVIQFPPSQLPESSSERHLLFQLPESEIKGMLSDTFEIDYIDAVSFPVDKVSQESKKE
ncbi:MAG TPA: hypothetical protein VK249_23470 [Anaerolineales bacterium]|nr:hypothetical protein [Anaerolineales bacterium]